MVNAVVILSLTPASVRWLRRGEAANRFSGSSGLVKKPRKLSGLRTLALAFRTPLKRGMCLAPRALVHASLGQRPRILVRKILARTARFTCASFSAIILHSQSFSKVSIHIIFSTKDREAWLDHDVRPRMHEYVATVC